MKENSKIVIVEIGMRRKQKWSIYYKILKIMIESYKYFYNIQNSEFSLSAMNIEINSFRLVCSLEYSPFEGFNLAKKQNC